MQVVGRVSALWRYPVKSMRGQPTDEVFVGFAGIYGDRTHAVHRAGTRPGFPFLTAREVGAMLQYQPQFRDPDAMALPPNLRAAQAEAPGATPMYAGPTQASVDITTPSGEVFAADDPRLLDRLRTGRTDLDIRMVTSDRSFTDCRPVSVISDQTIRSIGAALGSPLDPRRFRANIYADFEAAAGATEDDWLGRRLHLGDGVVVTILERDPRCKMITLDPETSEAAPDVIRHVTSARGGMAGVYGAVLTEGLLRVGDAIRLQD